MDKHIMMKMATPTKVTVQQQNSSMYEVLVMSVTCKEFRFIREVVGFKNISSTSHLFRRFATLHSNQITAVSQPLTLFIRYQASLAQVSKYWEGERESYDLL